MAELSDLYLDLLKRVLTRYLFGSHWERHGSDQQPRPVDAEKRRSGLDWPVDAETMIGLHRLDNLQYCIETALRDDVPGDIVEAGVWRGGAAIFARAVLKAHDITDRTVWAADSFQGLPPPDPARYPADQDDPHHTYEYLAVSLDQVKANFERYGLLDQQVRFLPGWFANTLPLAPIVRLAVLRVDGDMYGSTMDALDALYWRVSAGGYVIVDDYALPGCQAAVKDFRNKHGIVTPLRSVDWTGVYWRKQYPERVGQDEPVTGSLSTAC